MRLGSQAPDAAVDGRAREASERTTTVATKNRGRQVMLLMCLGSSCWEAQRQDVIPQNQARVQLPPTEHGPGPGRGWSIVNAGYAPAEYLTCGDLPDNRGKRTPGQAGADHRIILEVMFAAQSRPTVPSVGAGKTAARASMDRVMTFGAAFLTLYRLCPLLPFLVLLRFSFSSPFSFLLPSPYHPPSPFDWGGCCRHGSKSGRKQL